MTRCTVLPFAAVIPRQFACLLCFVDIFCYYVFLCVLHSFFFWLCCYSLNIQFFSSLSMGGLVAC